MKKLAVKAQLKLMEAKKRIKKMSGEVNTIEMLALIAIVLVVTLPLYKSLLTVFMGDVERWFQTVTSNIFTS